MSALVTINGKTVIDMRLCVPRNGAWHADLSVDDPDVLSGDVELVISDQLTLQGVVRRGGVDVDVGVYRVVAGKGGLPKTTAAKSYRQTTARIVVQDILADAGETLSSTASSSMLSTQLAAWVKFQVSSSRALAQLLDTLGDSVGFRVLPDGTVWLGEESWPTSKISNTAILVRDDRLAKVSIVTDDGLVLPGEVFDGRHVSYAEYETVDGSDLSGEVWFE